MLGRRVAAILVLFLLCSGALYLAADAATPPAAAPAPVTATPAQPSGKSLSLEEAVAMAIANSPRVAIANQEVAADKGLAEQATSNLFPRLNIAAQRTDTVAPKEGGTVFQQTGPAWATAVTLRQPLFSWGALRQGVKGANDLVAGAQDTFARTREQVAFAARAVYYQVLTAKESVRVQKDSLAAAQEHRRIAGLRFDAGVAPQYDVLAAEARVASVQQVMAASEGDLRNAWANLSRVLGAEVPTDTVLTSPRPLVVTQAPLATLIEQATACRSDILAARSQVSVAEAQLAIAKTGNLPMIALTLGYTFLPRTTVSGFGPEGGSIVVSQSTGEVGLGATWTAFDAGSTHGAVVTARARVQQACENVRLLEQAAEQEVKVASSDLQTAEAQQEAATKEVAAAKEAYRIAQVRYQEGVSTSVEVLDAQTTLSSAENRLNQAVFALNLAIAGLDLAVGAPATSPSAPAPK